MAGRPMSGTKGFWFQPCGWKQMWLEFIPRDGGGFINSYPYVVDATTRQPVLPEGVIRVGQFHYKFKDSGHECTHYRQLAGLVWGDGASGLEFTINFSATGLMRVLRLVIKIYG